MLESGPWIMLGLKALFIPAYLAARGAGRLLLARFGIRALDRWAQRLIGGLLVALVAGACLLAAAARLLFDLEPILPPFARIHATHFKWFLAEGIFVIAAGVAAGALSIDTPRRRQKLAAVSLALFCLFLFFERRYTRPVWEACLDRVEGGVTRQTFESTCGPASLCNLMREFGVELRERDAARVARTRPTGTTGDELALALPALAPGFSARYFKLTLSDVERIGLPGVLSFGEVHFVVWLGRRGHLHDYIDPSVGRCLYKEQDLLAEWDGKVLYAYPAPFDFTAGAGERHPGVPPLKAALALALAADPLPGAAAPASAGDDLVDPAFLAAYRRFVERSGMAAPPALDPLANLLVYSRARRAQAARP